MISMSVSMCLFNSASYVKPLMCSAFLYCANIHVFSKCVKVVLAALGCGQGPGGCYRSSDCNGGSLAAVGHAELVPLTCSRLQENIRSNKSARNLFIEQQDNSGNDQYQSVLWRKFMLNMFSLVLSVKFVFCIILLILYYIYIYIYCCLVFTCFMILTSVWHWYGL